MWPRQLAWVRQIISGMDGSLMCETRLRRVTRATVDAPPSIGRLSASKETALSPEMSLCNSWECRVVIGVLVSIPSATRRSQGEAQGQRRLWPLACACLRACALARLLCMVSVKRSFFRSVAAPWPSRIAVQTPLTNDRPHLVPGDSIFGRDGNVPDPPD